MTADLYFYNQTEFRKIPKRYRKLPEDLPESLRFAHLNPKVAALLANKERIHKQEKEDPFGDGLGQKSLIPDINTAFQNVRNQFDSALSNDEDSQRYLFEEAKYSAQGILEQLSRIIYFYEELYKHIPRSLEYQLMSGYTDLTADVTVIPREWQTQEMKEQYAASLQREASSDLEEFDDEFSGPRSRLGSTDKTPTESGSRMNMKKKSVPKLGVIEASPDEDIAGLEYRAGGRKSLSRQSMMSQHKLHIDVGASRMGSRMRKGSTMSGFSPSVYKGRIKDDQFSMIDETPSDLRSTGMALPPSYMQTINFQLSNKSFEEKGWIMLKGRHEEIDPNAIIEHCVTKLQETMKQSAALRQKEIELGYDKAVVVRYYGDTRKETILKFRKSPLKSTPSTVHKGGKPHIPSITDERNEGKKLMQASHIDGSTIIYYPSGRPAIIHSAAGYGRPGYYTILYEDGLDSKMLGCFTPSGKGVCYHPNGVVRFLSTEKGGHLSEENGALNRKWKWPQANVKITEPIGFQVNPHMLFRCIGRGQMTVVFNCHKETARFSVSPSPGVEDFKPGEDTEQLLTAFTFSSKTAKDLMRIFAPTKKQKKSKGRKALIAGLVMETYTDVTKRQFKSVKQSEKEEELTSELDEKSVEADDKSVESDEKNYPEKDITVKEPHDSSGREKTKKTWREVSRKSKSKAVEGKVKVLKKRGLIKEKKQESGDITEETEDSLETKTEKSKNEKDGRLPESKTKRKVIKISEKLKSKIKKQDAKIKTQQTSKKKLKEENSELEIDTEEKTLKKLQESEEGQLLRHEDTPVETREKREKSKKMKKQNDKTKEATNKVPKERKTEKELDKEEKIKQEFHESENVQLHRQEDTKSEKEVHEPEKVQSDAQKETETKAGSVLKIQKSETRVVINIIESITGIEQELDENLSEGSGMDQYLNISRALGQRRCAVHYVGSEESQESIHVEGDEIEDVENHKDGELSKSTEDKLSEKKSDLQKGVVKSDEVNKESGYTKDGTQHTEKEDNKTSESVSSGKSDSPSYISHSRGSFSAKERKCSSSHKATRSVSSAKEPKNSPALGKGASRLITGEVISNCSLKERSSLRKRSAYEYEFMEPEPKKHSQDQQPVKEISKKSAATNKTKKHVKYSGVTDGNIVAEKPEKLENTKTSQGKAVTFKADSVKKMEKVSLEHEPGLKKHSQDQQSVKEILKKGAAIDKIKRHVKYSGVTDRNMVEGKPGKVDDTKTSHSKKVTIKTEPGQKMEKHPSKSQTSEIVKLLQEFPDKVTYELEADKELARLQRKARNLVDDWMEHYRLALGFSSPALQAVGETPQYSIATRQAKSAKPSEQSLMIRKAILGIDDDDENVKRARVPSAPLGLSGGKHEEDYEDLLDVPLDTITKRDSAVTFEEPGHGGGDAGIVPSAAAIINRMADTASRRSARSKASSARSFSPSRQSVFTSMSERIPSALSSARSHCPLVIRQQILGYERPQCRCSRHHIPFIMDIELDEYVNTEVPEGQLIVIMVVSSLFPGITKAEEMLNEIYQNQNRNRTRPCVQSRSDMFRVFKYDINTAAEMSDHTQPLLLTRHNVVPGMFLMYCDGKLLFCDHIFNGYGNARKDFKKQVMKSRHDAINGYYLPRDFKFSPSRGRSGLRSAWGGEIGGTGVDKYSSTGTVLDSSLVPIHRPISSSSSNSKEMQLDAVSKEFVDLGPFHKEITVRLKPLITCHVPKQRLEEAAKLLATSLSSTGFQRMSLRPLVPQPYIPETTA